MNSKIYKFAMKKIVKGLLGGLGISVVLAALIPSLFLKDDIKWRIQSNFGRVDVVFSGDIRDGQIDVYEKSLRVDRPRWIRDGNGNQGVVVQFPVSFLRKTYQMTLKPKGNTQSTSLVVSFLGQDLRVGEQMKPAYVRFENIRLNGKLIAQEATVWHNKPFLYRAKMLRSDKIWR